MRVLHVDTGAEWRGGQVQLLALWHGLDRAGVAQRVLAPRGAPLLSRLDGVPWRVEGRWRGRHHLEAQIDAFAPDVVAAHTAHAVALCPRGAPLVVHRRVDFPPSAWGAHRYRRAKGVIAVSRAVAAIVTARTGAVRVCVVPDGVPEAHWVSPPATPRLLAVGALVPHKDHATLLEAMRGVPVPLDVLGDGPLRPALEARCRRLGLEGRVRFWGARPDVQAFMGRATALVHPSKLEGLGQVVLEAMSAGLPVVATSAGGLGEVVGGHGLLVPPGDPERLAAALREMLASHMRWRAHLGRTAPWRRRRWGVEAMVAGTLCAYREWA